MNAVEGLLAKEQIRALIATYAISFDDHDWDRFAQLWTEDAAFVVEDQAFEGREAMLVWIPQNFENAIVARYHDTFVRRDGRWLFARREETPLQYKPGPPPMSDAAVGVSGATMRAEGA